MTAGLLLLAAALLLCAYNLWDEHRAGQKAAAVLAQLPRADGLRPALLPEGEAAALPTVEVEGEAYVGVLAVPALGLELPVLDEWSEAGSRQAPCRYSGSAYTGDLILAGHNYRTHFGRLTALVPGDEVNFTNVWGETFRYTVAELEVLPGSAVEEMQAGEWDLTLFTCTYDGQSRLTLRCVAEAAR